MAIVIAAGVTLGVPGAAVADHRVFTLAGTDSEWLRLPRAGAGVASDVAMFPAGVAATGDGGLVVTDYASVRRIDARGRIRRVPVPGLFAPEDVALGPDGSMLFTEVGGDIFRVAQDGVSRLSVGDAHSDVVGVDGLPDGSVLAADAGNDRVWRVAPGRSPQAVAGTGGRGFAGDGGAATEARLNVPVAVSALPGGGFLIADRDNGRVRRVDAAGTITTVAGRGGPADSPGEVSGEGGPAVAARLGPIEDVRAHPDGGFLLVDAFGVRRVTADGRLLTLIRARSETVEGHRYFSARARLYTDAGPARAVQLQQPNGVEVDRDGSLLITTRQGVTILPAAGSQRLLAALPRENLTLAWRRRVAVTLTAPARVRVDVERAGRRVARVRARLPAGRSLLRLPHPLAGRTNLLVLTAKAADGRIAADRLRVLARARLPVATADQALTRYGARYIDTPFGFYPKHCRRRSARRVTCTTWSRIPDRVTAVLARDGSLRLRRANRPWAFVEIPDR
jgi:sugar lactone lactonase YvrE